MTETAASARARAGSNEARHVQPHGFAPEWISFHPGVEREGLRRPYREPAKLGMVRVQDVVILPRRRDAWNPQGRGDSLLQPIASESPRGVRCRDLPPIIREFLWSVKQIEVKAHRDNAPRRGGEQFPVVSVGDDLQLGQGAVFRGVDRADPKRIPSTRKLSRTTPVECRMGMLGLADPPSRDQANTPCSRRPNACSTSLAPCSDAMSERGVRPPRTRSGLASQPRALSSSLSTFTARTNTRISRAALSDSSGLSFPLAPSRRRIVFSRMLTNGAIPDGFTPKAAARWPRIPAGSPSETSSAILRSLLSRSEEHTSELQSPMY